MKNIAAVLIAILLLSFSSFKTLTDKTPNQLLVSVINKMQLVKNYSVDARIKADIPMIKALPVNAKIYFKQPNKLKVESKSVVILPKQGLNTFNIGLADTNKFTAILKGSEFIGTNRAQVVNVIPDDDTSDIILGKFWINEPNALLMRSQITTRSSGTVLIDYIYGKQKKYGMPDSMIFTVDVRKFKIPKGVAVDIQKSKTSKPTEAKNGHIYISLKNYLINQGIPDSKFK